MGDKPALRPGGAVGSALTAIARDVMAEGQAALGKIDQDDAAAVHDYRKAMKRWRAFLRLVEPLVGAGAHALRIEARDLARSLAGARDVQAVLDAIADIDRAELGLSKTSVASMRARIEAARRAAETEVLTADRRDALQAALARAAGAVDHWPLIDVTFAELAGALARHYGRARRAIPHAWADAADDDLHTLR